MQKSCAFTTFEKLTSSGMYVVVLKDVSGNIADRVRVDDYRNALAYLKSFNAIAKNMK